jgi:hypothetical protein
LAVFDKILLQIFVKITVGRSMMSAEERVRILSEAKPNSWVAFSADESNVLANADTYSEVVKIAREQGESEPVVIKTPESWLPRVFSLCL